MGDHLFDYSGFPLHDLPRRIKGTDSRPGPTSNSGSQTWRPGACPLYPWASRGTSSQPESLTVARLGPANTRSRMLRADSLAWAILLASVGSALNRRGSFNAPFRTGLEHQTAGPRKKGTGTRPPRGCVEPRGRSRPGAGPFFLRL